MSTEQNVVTLANTPVRRGPLQRPQGRLNADPVAIEVTDHLGRLYKSADTIVGEFMRLCVLASGRQEAAVLAEFDPALFPEVGEVVDIELEEVRQRLSALGAHLLQGHVDHFQSPERKRGQRRRCPLRILTGCLVA